MSSKNKQAEMNIIKQIAQENKYNESILNQKRKSSNTAPLIFMVLWDEVT
jgi:hypothetical protein